MLHACKVNSPNSSLLSSLHVTCECGHVKVAMTLINNGVAVNYQSKVVITYTVHCMHEVLY